MAEVHDRIDETDLDVASGSAAQANPLQGIRTTKRLTRLGVYLAILAYGPVYLFVLQYALRQVITSWVVGIVIATIAIEFAFTQMFKLRKRSAYPNVLIMQLGEAQSVDAAARLALPVLHRLLGVRASFIALAGNEGEHSLASVLGMSRTDAQRYLQAGAASIREATDIQQPVLWEPDGAESAEVRLNGDERLTFLPVVALHQPIGVLAVVGGKGNGDLKDGQLLTNIGSALGLSLENLRQKEELGKSEAKFRTLAETSAAATFIDQGARFVYVNSALEVISGYSREELLAMDLLDLIHPDFRELVREQGEARLRGEQVPSRYEIKIMTKSGEERWVDVTAGLIEFEGKPSVLGTAFDVTERKRAEEEREGLVSLVENSTDFIAMATLEGEVFFVNEAGRKLVGLSGPADLKGKRIPDFVAEDDLPELMDRMLPAAMGDGSWEGEFRLKHFKTGELIPIETILFTIKHPQTGQPTAIATVCRDITERKRAEETIRHLAYHDSLTDLPNRTLFEDRLTVALAQARRERRTAAVMFLDLDQFKVVNDTVGHAVGDQLLQSVAERLNGLVRDGDTVARVGGDEFTLLLPEVSGEKEDVVEVAERVLAALRQPWVLNGYEFYVTASIGIAMFPNDGEDADSLLRNADTAMYRAKDHGRDNYKLYTPAMNARIVERLALENSLRHGLERGEFLVYYQPQVDIASGKIVGMEALVRWQHPERGLVFPAEFIPVAEETGLIVPLGEWVLRTACAQNKAWQEAGFPPMRMAVNLSARQFQQRDLIEVVDEVLKETGLEARWLQLEITEGVAMQDVESNIVVLRELRQMGVQIAIDDFGTGHSSLSYLSRLPIDVVKIDQSFVRDLTTDPNDAAIARSIIVMAHNLKLKVIAEGVETEEQLAFLRKRRCDEMQGYLFSKPAPAEAFEEMLTQSGRTPRARRLVRASR